MSVDADLADLERLSDNVRESSAPVTGAANTFADNPLQENAFGLLSGQVALAVAGLCDQLSSSSRTVAENLLSIGESVDAAKTALHRADQDNAGSFREPPR